MNVYDINPSEVRSSKTKLPVFSRESCRLDLEGNSTMNYRIIKKPEFEIIGKGKSFDFEKFMKEAPKYWKKFVATKEYHL
jgi:AraC family transcriptional regulator